ncbi:MAG TPA: ABC transporter permease [Terriglobales bacterium]|nr:ABC transporter permease [Terriglobales bacterium]
MSDLLQDIHYAVRQMRKSPGFTVTAVLVLALGLGATTGMLAIVHSVLLRSLNYRHADRMVLVGVSDAANQTSNVHYGDFQEMQRNLHQFEELGAFSSVPLAVQTSDGAQMLVAPAVTTNLFDLLGVRPALGRSFGPGDDAPNAGVAIVSHDFWQHSMHARPDIVGSQLRVNQELLTVVGVMPPKFQFPLQTETVWIPLQLTPDQKTKQGFDEFSVLGRLKPGVTLDQAHAEGESFLRNKGNKSVETTTHFWLYPYQQLVTGTEKPALLALLAACFLLLAIAVVNAANLQIARATRREMEIAMRAALGASRTRILRQLIVESLVLAGAGGSLGWLLASGILQVARRLFGNYPRFDELRLDTWTFAGCLLLTILCGVAAGLAPAWHILKSKRDLSLQRSAAGRASRSHRLSGFLVASEVALTSILLVSAGLFLRTFRSLQEVPLGFNADHVTSFLLWPQGGDIPLAISRSAYQRTMDRLQSLPEVDAAGMVTSLPVSTFQITLSGSFSIPGHPAPDARSKREVRMVAVSPGYFRAMRIPLLSGRPLAGTDTESNQLVGIVNHAFVEQYLPNVSPIGKQVVLDKDPDEPATGIFPPITIVGVSGDVVQGNTIGTPILPEVAIPFQQLPAANPLTHFMVGVAASFVVRSSGDAGQVAGDVRNVVKSEAPEFAIDNLKPLSDGVQATLRTRQLAVQITSAFAWIALLLSAAGLYGVLAYLVGQRVREIGIRLALGATRPNVFALVVRQGLYMVGAGLTLGWIGALLAGRWIGSLLFGTTPHDPLTFTLAGALVFAVSAIAILLPARRASSIEPMEALRVE